MSWRRRLSLLGQKRLDEVGIAFAACPIALQASAPVLCAVGAEVQARTGNHACINKLGQA
jgi:hypothetical protein